MLRALKNLPFTGRAGNPESVILLGPENPRLRYQSDLEQAADFSGFGIHVDSSECRIGAGSGHQADGTCTGAEEFGA